MVLRALSSLLVAFALLQHAPLLSPVPPQSFRISGTVVDALSSQPLARALVSITSLALPDSTQAVTTGEDGRFAFGNLVAGHYSLFARRKGYVDQWYKQHEFLSTAIVVGPDLNSDNLRFELRPSASISGQVLDERSEPIRDAQVMLLRQGLDSGRRHTARELEVTSDDEGHYRFSHLSPGTYFVSVAAQPWYAERVTRERIQRLDSGSEQMVDEEVPTGNAALDVAYATTFFPNATDIAGASPITVHSGDAVIADMQLRPVPAVHLTFRSAAAEELEQFSLNQITQHITKGVEQSLPVRKIQNTPGIVEIVGLPPGRVNLGWASSKGSEVRTYSQTVQLGSDLEISPSDATPSASVTGVIQMEDGSPLSQPASLRLQNPESGATFDVQSEPTGAFAFTGQDITPGAYDIIVLQPSEAAVRKMSAVGGKVSGQTVEIGAGQGVRLTVVLSKGSGAVTGYALKDGKPLDGVMIVLVPQDPEHNATLFRRDQSDSDGSFNLSGILPGKYIVVAIENGWDLEWLSPSLLNKYLPGGETLRINANAKLEVKVNVQQYR
jgi:hypothetical protein